MPQIINAESFSGELQVAVTEDDGWYVAEDAITGVASQGKTREEALENLKEAVKLYHEE